MLRNFHTGMVVGLAMVAAIAAPPPPPASPSVPGVGQHRLKLKSFVFSTVMGPAGLLLEARVNDGPPLRLLLDSGAQNLVLDRRAAARSSCADKGTELDLVGPGGSAPPTVRKMQANTVDVGSLTLHNVDVLVAPGHLLDGIDGVFPLILFEDYLIRLDMRTRNLDLTPYTEGQATLGSPAISSNGLLFLKGLLNGVHEGYFLLDTGAAYNAVSTSFARRLKSGFALTRPVSVQGGATQLVAHPMTEVLRLEVGSVSLPVDPVLAVDLSTATRYHNLEVSGLLGYPALRDSVLTVNYRERRVHIEHK